MTEERPALHTALRSETGLPEINSMVRSARDSFLGFAQSLHEGSVHGHREQVIRHLVHIGLGGSDTGPRLLVDALASSTPLGSSALQVHFLSVPDSHTVSRLLAQLSADETIVVIASKSFTTQETMAIAEVLKTWFVGSGLAAGAGLEAHLAAVTAKPELAFAWGVPAQRCFPFWDWVGGRFSVWGPIGLTAAAALGRKPFEEFLAGGAAMDSHVAQATTGSCLPLQLALAGIWNRNFLGAASLVVAPYSDQLGLLPAFLQQLDMESNGKSVTTVGRPVDWATGPLVMGAVGITGQHAFFQWLHQGTDKAAIEFVGVASDKEPIASADELRLNSILNSNMRAQAQAFAFGRSAEETRAAILKEGAAEDLVAHRSYSGNTCSSLIQLARLDAFHLGALLALYEYKVIAQAVLWSINPFDQWGVELGKTIEKSLGYTP
jgi:glucose-6-phosphate isomerase